MRKYIQDMALIGAKVSIGMGTNSQGGHSLFLIHPVCMIVEGSTSGVSILISFGDPTGIFSEFMENSAKFMKNSVLTKWTQNLR